MSPHSGFPGYPSAQSPRLGDNAREISRSSLFLLAGIVATLLLFLALPFTQVLSSPIERPTIIIDAHTVAPPPEWVVPPPPKQEKVKPDNPVLDDPVPPVPIALIPVGPIGDGPGYWVGPTSEGIKGIVPDIFTPDQLTRQPVPIHQVAPVIRAGHSGDVLVEFVVTPQGTVTAIRVISSSHRSFEQPVIAAISKWRFEPGIKDSTPVATRMRLPIRYTPSN